MLKIVCAANETPNDEIIVGVRHFDQQMHDTYYALGIPTDAKHGSIQGFIANDGKFYNRQEAWKIAEAASQIFRSCGGDEANGGTLYSENLY